MSYRERGVLSEPSQTRENPAVLIRTGGGNAPSLMGLRVLEHLNRRRGIQGLPLVNGIFPIDNQRQVGMLRREATDPNRVLVDASYAAIVDPFVSSHGRFSEHVDIVAGQSDATKGHLLQRFGVTAEPFAAMSLGLGETVSHEPRDIISVLDAGSRYPAINHPDHYFFFPVLASQLWQSLREEQLAYDPSIQISDERLAVAIRKMQDVEAGYRMILLSKVNSFSYLHIPGAAQTMEEKYAALADQPRRHLGRPIRYTPPMSPNMVTAVSRNDVKTPSMYVMFSGTGSSIAETNALIPGLVAAGYDIYVPESAIKFGDVSEANKELVKVTSDPNITGHPLVTNGIARPGFGTIWDNENAGIGTNRPPHVLGDDHEMVVNGRTIDALEIGEELVAGQLPSAEELRRRMVQISFNARELKERQLAEFRTKDGLAVVAARVASESSPGVGSEITILDAAHPEFHYDVSIDVDDEVSPAELAQDLLRQGIRDIGLVAGLGMIEVTNSDGTVNEETLDSLVALRIQESANIADRDTVLVVSPQIRPVVFAGVMGPQRLDVIDTYRRRHRLGTVVQRAYEHLYADCEESERPLTTLPSLLDADPYELPSFRSDDARNTGFAPYYNKILIHPPYGDEGADAGQMTETDAFISWINTILSVRRANARKATIYSVVPEGWQTILQEIKDGKTGGELISVSLGSGAGFISARLQSVPHLTQEDIVALFPEEIAPKRLEGTGLELYTIRA